MTLDAEMAEIAKIFFQETREGLEAMESGLLNLSTNASQENIDVIFRAAHSIKGGSATFGFEDVASFTHGVETLLDEIRKGVRPITAEIIQILLQSCDCLGDMIAATEAVRPLNTERIAAIGKEIDRLRGTPAVAAAPSSCGAGWRILFEPVADLLRLRNEPVRMFDEVARLGEFAARADVSLLPTLEALDPEACYLSWSMTITGQVPRHKLDEIFDWVDSRCRLEITAIEDSTRAPTLAAPAGGTALKASTDSGSIRVATGKIDHIINLVGELLITQSMLCGFGECIDAGEIDRLRQGLSQLARNTRELQESVMQIRMLPISFAFNRFPRLVHDLARKLGKKVELTLVGEATELDKTVLEKISDPLVHLVRNALDHGLETPERRLAAGKRETGSLELGAYHEGGNINIEVRDDGAGLNRTKILRKAEERALVSKDQQLTGEQIDNLIFTPGFSTADSVSDVSGRGVGMDVVRQNINDLGGHVQILSKEGAGSTIRIRLPLTLAILDGQLVRVGREIYVISLLAIIETIQVARARLNKVSADAQVFRLRGEFLPVVKLCDHFAIAPDGNHSGAEGGLLVVVEAEGTRVGVLVDDLLAQQQVVIKNLDTNFKAVPAIAGATILGDGTVALIIDVPNLIRSVVQAARERDGRMMTNDGAIRAMEKSAI